MKYIAPKTKILIVELNSALCTSPTGGLNSQKGEGSQLSPARKLYI